MITRVFVFLLSMLIYNQGSSHLDDKGCTVTEETSRTQACVFKTYVSSPFERFWLMQLEMADINETLPLQDYCTIFLRARSIFGDKCEVNPLINPSYTLLEEDKACYSYFVHDCIVDDLMGVSIEAVTWIEPLAFGLRSPHAISCEQGQTLYYQGHKLYYLSDLLNKEYLLLESKESLQKKQNAVPDDGSKKNILFDLGSSIWGESNIQGGDSQEFLYSKYRDNGIKFDRALYWDLGSYSAENIYSNIPEDFFHAYQFFNWPVETNVTSQKNPLNILKQIAKPSDFVTLKIDIDTPIVEHDLLEYFLIDEDLHSRVDEFLYEAQPQFGPMISCCWHTKYDEGVYLKDIYAMFLRLRRKGIRAHGWV